MILIEIMSGIERRIEEYKDKIKSICWGFIFNLFASLIVTIFSFVNILLLKLPKTQYYTPNAVPVILIMSIFSVLIPILFMLEKKRDTQKICDLINKLDWFSNFSEINWNLLFYIVGYYSITTIILFYQPLTKLKEFLGVSIAHTALELIITIFAVVFLWLIDNKL
jgi:hypothetical protein